MNIKELRKQAIKTQKEAKKLKKISLFSISTTVFPELRNGSFTSIRETEGTLAATLMVTKTSEIDRILRAIDGTVDYVLVDVESKRPGFLHLEEKANQICHQTKILTYKPNDISADSLDAFLSHWFKSLRGVRIAVLGCGNLGAKISIKLVERGADVRIFRRDYKKAKAIQDGIRAMMVRFGKGKIRAFRSVSAVNHVDVVIGAAPNVPLIDKKIVRRMRPRGLIIDAGTGNIDPSSVSMAEMRGIRVVCLNIQSGYEGAIANLFKSKELLRRLGRREKNGSTMISGGLYGRPGEVIVDDINNPKRIYGVADGRGNLIGNQK